jgi:D-lactate dehydrogenase
VSKVLANSFSKVEKMTRVSLAVMGGSHRLIGSKSMGGITGVIRKLSANKIPLWSKYLPQKASYYPKKRESNNMTSRPKVVYMPSCASRSMGQSITAKDQRSLTEVTFSLIEKAGFDVISPDFTGECCGMPFNSKGMFSQANQKRDSLLNKLRDLSEQGKYPILIDTSPCKSMLLENKEKISGLSIYEPVGFIEDILVNHLDFFPIDETVMLHVTCTSRTMGLADKMQQLAERCSTAVVLPEHIHCCGFAGDKGFTTPELNKNALAPLKAQIPKGCNTGYSNSRTCEIGLSHHAGIDYQSIIYLVDKVSTQKITS